MAGTTPAVALPPPGALASFYRFTVEQYHRMIETGVLTEDDRVELLEGWIYNKLPHNPPHPATITRVARRLSRVLPEDWLVRIQSPITTTDSELEPDLAVVSGPEEVYFSRHPGPADVGLLIEVADTTLELARGEKRRLYARARIAEYWIVNIPESQVEVYTSPRAGKEPTYRRRRDHGREEAIRLTLGGQEIASIAAGELLPPAG
jgi:Uma2 family endonuclease